MALFHSDWNLLESPDGAVSVGFIGNVAALEEVLRDVPKVQYDNRVIDIFFAFCCLFLVRFSSGEFF